MRIILVTYNRKYFLKCNFSIRSTLSRKDKMQKKFKIFTLFLFSVNQTLRKQVDNIKYRYIPIFYY